MSSEPDVAGKLEIAHILFTDIVSFSKLSMEEQKTAIHHLANLVRETEAFRQGNADNLIRLTTGDGFALVFFDDPEAPIKCARELGRKLRADPVVKLRMGLHSGAVYRISNLNERVDVTGSGINMAQRVMDCGDAGHILASSAVANNLGGLAAWSEDFHDLEQAEIKGGGRIRIHNVYGKDYGNPELPAKLGPALPPPGPVPPKEIGSKRRVRLPFSVGRKTVLATAAALVLMLVGILAVLFISGSQRRSLAVIPFSYETDEEKTLAVDLPRRLASNLSDLGEKLSVKQSKDRTYEWQPLSNLQALGRNLGADTLLKGSLKKTGSSISVEVQLINVSNGEPIWKESYHKELAQVSQVEQDIALRIADSLSLRLTDKEKESLRSGPSKNAEANKLYEEGLSQLAVRKDTNIQEAVASFKKAVAVDPKYARAYAKLADSLVLLNVYGATPSTDRMTEAEAAAKNGLELNSKLPDAHVSLAYINFRHYRNWRKAEEEFKLAIELDPLNAQAHDWYADYLEAMNRHPEAVAQMLKAVELDREAIWVNADLGLALGYANRFEDAKAQLTMTLALPSKQPADFVQAHNYLGLIYEIKGDLKESVAEYEKALALNGASPRLKAILAHAYAKSGQKAQALQLVNELARNEKQQLYYLALAYAALPDPGDKTRAFQLLTRALENNEPGIVFLMVDPRFSEDFRKDPRFSELLRQLNLPPA